MTKRVHPNYMLLALLLVLAGLTLFLRRDYLARNAEILPGMVHSVPAEAQAPLPAFPDHRALHEPARGSIPMEFQPVHYRRTPEEALRAGVELSNPVRPDSVEERERGAFVFITFCQPCHGSGGMGDGKIVQHGFPPPPSLLADRAVRMKDGQMFHVMTYGQGNMPSLASQVEARDRWRAIVYIRSLQAPKGITSGK
ncbi:MAG: cytochrome c [Ignavibacteria bacterium]|nr:cytochrome c [Ignavibacteria bacterium]